MSLRIAESFIVQYDDPEIMSRSREMVLDDILELCKEPKSVSQIVYQANLNFMSVRPHLNGLIRSGLIEEIPGYPVCYKTTPKGVEILEKIKEVEDLLKPIC